MLPLPPRVRRFRNDAPLLPFSAWLISIPSVLSSALTKSIFPGSCNRAVVAEFSDDAGFQRRMQQRKCNNEILQYLFCERNYSKRRVCFIVDLMAVRVIFDTFWSESQSGELILSSGELAEHWDQEKVEVCMCLKKYMCLTLWKLIGA